jgi:hypothetical protein
LKKKTRGKKSRGTVPLRYILVSREAGRFIDIQSIGIFFGGGGGIAQMKIDKFGEEGEFRLFYIYIDSNYHSQIHSIVLVQEACMILSLDC